MKGYVTYQDRRYRVVGQRVEYLDGHGDRTILRLRPFKGADVQADAKDCKPWKRSSGTRMARGTKVNIRLDTNAEMIEAWERGRRTKLTCTFTGLYQLLARQLASNQKRDRAFARRTGRRA